MGYAHILAFLGFLFGSAFYGYSFVSSTIDLNKDLQYKVETLEQQVYTE